MSCNHKENKWTKKPVRLVYDPLTGQYVAAKDCHKKCDRSASTTTPASFRAVKGESQEVPAATLVKVLYEVEQFDNGFVYNPGTSTFLPIQGVYSVIASLLFSPDVDEDYRARIDIYVNGEVVASDNDFFSPIGISNIVSVSTILQLEANDVVEIFMESSVAGTILASPGTHFEAARFPSAGLK